jgi:hypothetical protein
VYLIKHRDDIWGSEDTAITFLTSADFPPGKEPLVPIGQKAGWASEPVSTTWRGEKFYLYRDSNSGKFLNVQNADNCGTLRVVHRLILIVKVKLLKVQNPK